MKHVWEKHTNCEEQSCIICDGGLAVCTVCGLVDGCLTTDCPGEPVYRSHGEAVYQGELDYVEWQGWVIGDGVTGFGDSPAEAYADFDRAWHEKLPVTERSVTDDD